MEIKNNLENNKSIEKQDLILDNKKRTKCEIWSRVVGYLRPVQQWNSGKECEFKDRKTFNINNIN